MIRSSLVTIALVTLALAAGCDNASNNQQKATAAQNEANDKIAAATREAEQKGKNAQAAADKQIAEAQANFMKLREDYRHATTTNLAGLDRKVADLEAKEKRMSGKAASDLEAKLKDIRGGRATFTADYNTLEATSAATWDDTKARLDKEWTDLAASVDAA